MTTPRQAPSQFQRLSKDEATAWVKRKKRAIVRLAGQEKSGKTDWPIRTGKPPIFYLQIDPNSEFTVKKLVRELPDKDIRVADFKVQGVTDFMDHWQKFRAAYEDALMFNDGTLIIDTETDMYELVRDAQFANIAHPIARDYAPVNEAMNKLLNNAHASDMTVIFLTKMHDEWINDKSTGRKIPHGWNDMQYKVQVNLEAYRDVNAFAAWKAAGMKAMGADGSLTPWPFHIYVTDCVANMGIADNDYTTAFFGVENLIGLMQNV